MTKSMRWSVGSMLVLGGLAALSFVGCSDDAASNPPVDTDTGVADTGSTDTGTPPDTATPDVTTDVGDTSDAPPFVADRAVTLIHASPDFGSKFICLGAFLTDPATSDPAQSIGPIGVPTEATKDPKKFVAIPYGAVIPVPLSATAVAALGAFNAVMWAVDTNPLTATPPVECKDTWKAARADTNNWVKVDKGTVNKGESWIVAMKGCKNASTATTSECGASGAAASFKWGTHKLDVATPSAFGGGTTGPKTGIQVVHFSKFEGVSGAIPSFQNIEVYIQAMAAPTGGGDAGTDGATDALEVSVDAATDAAPPTAVPVGLPFLVAGDKAGAAGVKYDDIVAKAVGLQLAGDPNEALLVVAVHGTTPCLGGPSVACPTAVTVPLKKFLDAYKLVGGGFNDGQNQFIALFGSPVPKTSGDPTTATFRAAFGRIGIP